MRTLAFALLLFPCASFSFAQQPRIDSVKLKAMQQEAQAAANAGDFDKASQIAKQAIAMGVQDSSVYYLTSIVLAMAGKKDEAKLYYDTALAKGYDPNTDAANMLGLNPSSKTENVNYDSAFAAIHADAVEKSKVLPKGAKNRTLYQDFIEDQAERKLLFGMGGAQPMNDGITRMVTNDATRRKYVYSILPKLEKSTRGKDLEEAGFILQHGNDTTDYWNAHELALRAVTVGDSAALWLAAATLDRYLVNKGKAQLYGTQSTRNDKTGKYELYPVDPTITDAERAKWHVPALAEEEKQVNVLYNQK